jgi:hypothetical protein
MGVALLAPVPSLHLKSAVETCIEQGKVAFGSMSVDVFGKLEREFGFGIPVYIYASIGLPAPSRPRRGGLKSGGASGR